MARAPTKKSLPDRVLLNHSAPAGGKRYNAGTDGRMKHLSHLLIYNKLDFKVV